MDRLPVVFCVPNLHSTERIALDISTKQFCTIDYPVFQDACCIYSKDGWLLLRSKHQHPRCESASLILLNPSTGAIFDLPRINNYGPGPFTFSTDSGVPDRVIRLGNQHGGISIHMIRPGDEAWEMYVFQCEQFSIHSAVALVGMQVLCIDPTNGRVVIFDLLERSWLYFSHDNKPRGVSQYIVDGEGEEIVRVCCPFPSFSYFSFSKLDLRRIDWVEMDDFELENTSWFLDCRRRCSFRAKEEGKKVYTLEPKNSRAARRQTTRLQRLVQGRPVNPLAGPQRPLSIQIGRVQTPEADIESNVYIHNLANGSYQSLLSNSFLAKSLQWADIDTSS